MLVETSIHTEHIVGDGFHSVGGGGQSAFASRRFHHPHLIGRDEVIHNGDVAAGARITPLPNQKIQGLNLRIGAARPSLKGLHQSRIILLSCLQKGELRFCPEHVGSKGLIGNRGAEPGLGNERRSRAETCE